MKAKLTIGKRLDNLVLTVAEMENKQKVLMTALAQELHNMQVIVKQGTAKILTEKVESLDRETKRVLMGLAEKIDALQPRRSLFRRLLRL